MGGKEYQSVIASFSGCRTNMRIFYKNFSSQEFVLPMKLRNLCRFRRRKQVKFGIGLRRVSKEELRRRPKKKSRSPRRVEGGKGRMREVRGYVLRGERKFRVTCFK
jgi:hypothetical protein